MQRLRAGSSSELRRLSATAAEIARIEDGELLFGIDFSGENFPQETGRDSAVSYTKGCYLGQEVVARIHYRGGVQRLPRGLRFDADRTPDAGAELLLRRPVRRPRDERHVVTAFRGDRIGLAASARCRPGTRLEVVGRRRGRGRGAALRQLDQTANDEPQPQVPVAFGLLNLNPAPFMPKT